MPCGRKDVIVEVGFEVPVAQGMPTVTYSLLLWTVDQNVEVSFPTSASCLPACRHAPP